MWQVTHGPKTTDDVVSGSGRAEAACTLLGHCVSRAGVGGDGVALPADPRILPNLTAGAALAFLTPELVLKGLESPVPRVGRHCRGGSWRQCEGRGEVSAFLFILYPCLATRAPYVDMLPGAVHV